MVLGTDSLILLLTDAVQSLRRVTNLQEMAKTHVAEQTTLDTLMSLEVDERQAVA